MFEWPIASRIDMDTYPRRALYEHFLTFEIPVASRTVQLDVTSLIDFVKTNNYRFSLVIGFIISRAVNHVPELRHRIEDGALVEFNKIIPSFTILSKDKLVYFSKGVFTDVFENDYYENLAINEHAAKGLDQNVGSENQGQIFITNNPWNSFTALQFPYSKKVSSIPVFGIGKMYNDNDKIKAPLAIQNHHSLTDGYHIGHFLDILEKHLKEPRLIERPFTSTFK
jgi:chloramphenicol O-acetyltransferase type A